MAASPGCKKLLNSIEKRFVKMRNVLTPRRKYNMETVSPVRPTVLTSKEVCNVSTTSYSDADEVLNELKLALLSKGITCKVKGYTLRGKMFSDNGKSCKLSFELEVCLIKSSYNKPSGTTDSTESNAGVDKPVPNSGEPGVVSPSFLSPELLRPIVGVRRKRLTGDAWCYKKVCEEILTLTSSREEVCQAKRVKV
uniref:non-specific serine/threonine protein kinase n=2 Tax=Cacopsylla melanoneura TaxID=428564 RepID=A0A8D8QR94_9HEMI